MSRILLADDSPHAQRMGERILREEGYEVVSVTDGDTAIQRMLDVDPDLIIADAFLPGRNGFELCRYAKLQPAHRHVRVVMTAGLLEAFDEDEARRAGADAIIKKPFEASMVIQTIIPLIRDAQHAKKKSKTATAQTIEATAEPEPPAKVPAIDARFFEVPVDTRPLPVETKPLPVVAAIAPRPLEAEPPPPAERAAPPVVAETPAAPAPVAVEPVAARESGMDPELVRAAVTVALDAAMPALVDDITERVLSLLREKQHQNA
jgi:CheY-like chemotaxis protein